MSAIKIARRMSRIEPSPSSVISQRARELKAQGEDIIALSSGVPDFETPDHVVQAAHEAALRGETRYTSVAGMPALKAAIRDKFKRENGLEFADNEVMVGNGSKQVLFNALTACVEEGDEVIVPAPYYAAYLDMVKVTGAEPVVVECGIDTEFKLTPAKLEAAITPATRLLLLNSPNNPTGAVLEEADLKGLAEVLRRHPQVAVLTDDVYEHIVFDGLKAPTMASVAPDLGERTITVNGISKAYAMTGWRIGYAGGPAAVIKEMVTMQSVATTGASSIGQAAALAALTGPQDFMAERAKSFEDRRDLVVSMLNQSTGLSCPTPKGAFYVYPSCAGVIGKKTPDGKIIETDRDFVAYLLEHEKVAVVQGEAYGVSPAFRIAYSYSVEELTEACQRIQRACANLR